METISKKEASGLANLWLQELLQDLEISNDEHYVFALNIRLELEKLGLSGSLKNMLKMYMGESSYAAFIKLTLDWFHKSASMIKPQDYKLNMAWTDSPLYLLCVGTVQSWINETSEELSSKMYAITKFVASFSSNLLLYRQETRNTNDIQRYAAFPTFNKDQHRNAIPMSFLATCAKMFNAPTWTIQPFSLRLFPIYLWESFECEIIALGSTLTKQHDMPDGKILYRLTDTPGWTSSILTPFHTMLHMDDDLINNGILRIGNQFNDISKKTFLSDSRIKELFLDNVYNVSDQTFKGCTNLQKITIQCNTELTIHHSAFQDCTQLQSVTITGNDTIDFYSACFKNCGMLHSFNCNVPFQISEECFQNCTALTTIDLSTTEYLFYKTTKNAFKGCLALKRVIIPTILHQIAVPDFAAGGRMRLIQMPKDYIIAHLQDLFPDCPQLTELIYEGDYAPMTMAIKQFFNTRKSKRTGSAQEYNDRTTVKKLRPS